MSLKPDSFRDSPRFMRRSGETSGRRSWLPMPVKRRPLVTVLCAALLVLIIGGWELASRFDIIDPFFFSQPSVFAARALRWLGDPAFLLRGPNTYQPLPGPSEE